MAAALALAALLVIIPARAAVAGAPQPPYDWFRYQGASDSGLKAGINCEVTSVAMSIQYARDNLRVPITTIREFMGKEDLTSTADAQRALAHWGVPYRAVDTVQEIIASLDRGHIVMVGLMMNRVSPGTDYQTGASAPALRFGRYYPFDGPHSVVVKGVTEDKGWFIVNDPNVWDGNPIYWYSDGTPKGKDRYYPVAEFARGMADLGDSPKGLEILAAPSPESVRRTADQAQAAVSPAREPSGQNVPPRAPEFPRQYGDLVALGSSSGSWKSVTFIFRLYNPRGEPLAIAQAGVQGRDPTGREFFAPSTAVTLLPGGDAVLAIPMAVSEAGVWRVHRILYFAEGAWRELPAAGFRQQMEFIVR